MKLRKILLLASAFAVAGLLSSCMQLSIRSENWKSLDIYGKVLDQYGNPVSNATVRGAIGLNISMVESGGKFIYTQTDVKGCFHFLHIHGAGIGIWPQKSGYYYNLKIPWQRPSNYEPDPASPIVFRMWKIRGAEPLVNSGIDSKLTKDETAQGFDIESGNKSDDGDFKISFHRAPDENKPGLVHPFDWRFKIEIPNGGLMPENDPYPFWAPDAGYQPSFELAVSSNSPSWQSQYSQSFYIKTASGKYGVLQFDISSAYRPPHFHANFILNPSGSQNLEPGTFP